MGKYTYEDICSNLWGLIPDEEFKRLDGTIFEMRPEFLGFCDIYYHLSQIIPKDWTIIDFGAANNPQSYFFTEHKNTSLLILTAIMKKKMGCFVLRIARFIE